jgi:transcriptional regulator with GAF, ATPase, and Fis domain
MHGHALLAENVSALRQAAGTFLSIRGLGIVLHDDAEHVVVTWAGPTQVSATRVRLHGSPAAIRAWEFALARVAEENQGTGHALTVPIPGRGDSALLVVVIAGSSAASEEQIAGVQSLASRTAGLLEAVEPPESELGRLRRLAGLEPLARALFRTRSLGRMVEHLSRISRDVMPFDILTLRVVGDDQEQPTVYVHSPGAPVEPTTVSPAYAPVPVAEGLQYELLQDIHAHRPGDVAPFASEARSMLRVPIHIDGRLGGSLEFLSFAVGRFASDDVAVAKRIADDVSLAISYQRLASENRDAAALRARESSLELLDSILSTVSGVLDVREVFDRIFEISQRAMPHDAMAIAIANPEATHVKLYATTGAIRHLPIGLEIPMPDPSLVQREWEFELIEDMLEDPRYVKTNSAKAGMRSLIMIPVRLDQRVRGWVNFFSRTPRYFTPDDVSVARRIAAHIVLTLSHQRLAKQARLTEELRARTTNLELLDEILTTLVDSGDLTGVFGRISAIAGKVLQHDAAALMVRLPDGVHARVYALSGIGNVQPEVTEIPEELLQNPEWEYDILDDLSVLEHPRYVRLSAIGFRSLLRVPIRLEGRFAGGLVFLSKSRAAFTPTDVPVARRMADRMTVTVAREREIEASKRADEATDRAAKLEARVRALTDELDSRTGYRRVVGESKRWRQVLTQATQVASTETTVLLLGESGTGKEVVARFVHRGSPRNRGPFIALNCAALPEQLLEAELFGYERGAYTGATQSKPGQLEQAAGGTLFLDEVGEMSPSAQAKFLRVLQEREFQRLGGTRVLRSDARVVAATNRDLQRAIANGQFREDLYYRLNVFAIRLPALRDRKDDVLPLSDAFLTEIGKGLGRPPGGISREARELLVEYHWPGNVRELRNILERAAILCDGGLITPEHLAFSVSPPMVSPPPPMMAPANTPAAADPATPPQSVPAGDLQSMERSMIEQALQNARFNKSKAAKALGLTRHQLYIRMRKYGFE